MDKKAEVAIPLGNEQTLNQDKYKWRKGYFSCFSDLGICASVTFLPCVPFHFLVKHLEKRGAISNALTLSIIFTLCAMIYVCWEALELFGIIKFDYETLSPNYSFEDITTPQALLLIGISISSFSLGMMVLLILAVRFQIIKERNIAFDIIKETLMSWICTPCALCQAAREYSGPNQYDFFTV